MANLTYHKVVNSITDGSRGVSITSGEVDAILPYLTSQQRITGITQLEKFYITSDITLNVFVGVTSLGLFTASLIGSANAGEVASAITGANDRHGSSKILSNTASGCVIEDDPIVTRFRVGDLVLVGNVVVEIATITAQGANRTITYLHPIANVDLVGTNATTMLQMVLTANVAVPLWIENIIPPSAVATQTYNTLPIVIVS